MNTKKLILFFPCLLFATLIFSQAETQESVTQRLNQYFEATKNKDWDTVINLLYPKLFELVPKEDMKQVFVDMEGNGMELNMKSFEILDISAPVAHEGQKYALVNYTGAMNIRFTSQAHKEPEVINMLKKSFQDGYGEENVSYQQADNSFDLTLQKALFAISPEDNNEWTFIESDMGEDEKLKQLIPESVKVSLLKE